MRISWEAPIAVSSEVLFRELDGESVLLDLKSETYFGLDEIGTQVWQLLEEHKRLQPVVDALLTKYDVEESRLRDDLARLVGQLAEAGLITVGGEEVA